EKHLRALREASKGCACKRSRDRACVTEFFPGRDLFLKRSASSQPFFISGARINSARLTRR
ncbi:TPA: hypothetical protein ACYLN4_008670, partial [Burkholderia lata]